MNPEFEAPQSPAEGRTANSGAAEREAMQLQRSSRRSMSHMKWGTRTGVGVGVALAVGLSAFAHTLLEGGIGSSQVLFGLIVAFGLGIIVFYFGSPEQPPPGASSRERAPPPKTADIEIGSAISRDREDRRVLG